MTVVEFAAAGAVTYAGGRGCGGAAAGAVTYAGGGGGGGEVTDAVAGAVTVVEFASVVVDALIVVYKLF